jgi:hypothetical protein
MQQSKRERGSRLRSGGEPVESSVREAFPGGIRKEPNTEIQDWKRSGCVYLFVS